MKAVKRNMRWEEVNKGHLELSQLIQHFEVFNRSEGKSTSTVTWYSEVLHVFLKWLISEGRSTNLSEVGEKEVRAFILHLYEKKVRGKPMSRNSVANRIRGVCGFFSWLAAEKYTEGDILANIKTPKIAETVVEPLKPAEVDLLFSKINNNTALGARNAAILALFLDTGLRLSEIASLKQCDTHLDQRYVKVFGREPRKESCLWVLSVKNLCYITVITSARSRRIKA